MKQKTNISIGGILLAILAAFFYSNQEGQAGTSGNSASGTATQDVSQPAVTQPAVSQPSVAQAESSQTTSPQAGRSQPASVRAIGFTSPRSWQEHYKKHGAEFGRITADDYLEMAKALRDAPLSQDVLEIVRADDVITRFDRRKGHFVAFHQDLAIKTFFRPNDGEAYFRRQAKR